MSPSLSLCVTIIKVIQRPIDHHAGHNEDDHEPSYHIQCSICCIMYWNIQKWIRYFGQVDTLPTVDLIWLHNVLLDHHCVINKIEYNKTRIKMCTLITYPPWLYWSPSKSYKNGNCFKVLVFVQCFTLFTRYFSTSPVPIRYLSFHNL